MCINPKRWLRVQPLHVFLLSLQKLWTPRRSRSKMGESASNTGLSSTLPINNIYTRKKGYLGPPAGYCILNNHSPQYLAIDIYWNGTESRSYEVTQVAENLKPEKNIRLVWESRLSGVPDELTSQLRWRCERSPWTLFDENEHETNSGILVSDTGAVLFQLS